MINISVKQGAPVQSENHKLKYELDVTYMHGDADGYTHHIVHYTNDEHDEMLLDILGLVTASNSGEDVSDSEEIIAAIFESQGVEDAYDRASEWRDQFYEGDITNEGRAAFIDGYKLFYYDGDGVKHHVDTIINGKKI